MAIANALQLEGRSTSRQSFWAVSDQIYTANSELPIKILTSTLDSATPDFLKGSNNLAIRRYHTVNLTFHT